jgi:hypothetical protein
LRENIDLGLEASYVSSLIISVLFMTVTAALISLSLAFFDSYDRESADELSYGSESDHLCIVFCFPEIKPVYVTLFQSVSM